MTPEMTQEEAEMEAEAQNAEAKAQTDELVGGAAPEADEPLDPSRLNTLADTVKSAAEKLSGGQIGDLDLEKVEQPQDMVPSYIFAGAAAFAAFAEDIGMEEFKFDATDLARTNKGIAEMAATISQMSDSKEVQKALNQPAAAPKEPEPTFKFKDDDLDEFVP